MGRAHAPSSWKPRAAHRTHVTHRIPAAAPPLSCALSAVGQSTLGSLGSRGCRGALAQQYGSSAGCTPLALHLPRGPRLAPRPCYFKNHHTLLALHFKFKGQQNTIKHKAIIPRSSQSPAISKQSQVWIIERLVSAGYESMKEGSPEPAHNSQPVGKLP